MSNKVREISCQAKFNQIFANVSRLLGVIGFDVLDPDFGPNWKMIYPCAIIFCAMLQILYLLNRSDMVQFLVIVPYAMYEIKLVDIMVQCVAKSGMFQSLKARSDEIFELLCENPTNKQVMDKDLKVAIFLQKFIFGWNVQTSVLMIPGPVLVWLVSGKMILFFLYRLPIIDDQSAAGFLLNLIYHAAILLIPFCNSGGIDSLLVALIVPISAFINAIANEVFEINELLETDRRDELAIKTKLNRIARLHQLLLEYVSLLEDTFNGMALVRIGTIVLGTISAIITFFETGDPMTFVFIPVLFVQLSQCCLLGTIIPVKNEELIEHLYDIKWYLLPEGHAKHVSLMLHQAQNAPTLTIGKYAPLNVESYEQILNSIYSFVTFLITFTG
ncbi:Odorant receptor 83c [Culex quinquefasciatus]|uniref:Odorant receptor n=1 Tax=Culex quinquefasciatus TaxID=7176 RepID=B0WJK3_CULQU|nr:Odorant receptor 83c [Culex quinquefasciatus]|eukprot:XP_001848887.1 Odorant receptor 83c [Culex quinquefasciatus]